MAKFEKLYMRPNQNNTGDIPATGDMCTSPDIWIAGTTPIADFKTVLATDDSYAGASGNSLTANYDNYIYVRGKNGSAAKASNNVTLYWSNSALIQWPGKWQKNVLGTDKATAKAQITNVEAGKIGVADAPFIWANTPEQPTDGSHYCLMAQFNDDQNSNPFPNVQTVLEMSILVANNLQWGWRNVGVCKNDNMIFSYQTQLDVPANVREAERKYLLYLQPPKDLIGFEIAFQCSQVDSQGKNIAMSKTIVTQDGQILGCECVLKPGFSGTMSVYLTNPNNKPIPYEATLPFVANYFATTEELQKANALSLHNSELTGKIIKHLGLKGIDHTNGAIIPLGSYTGVLRK
jgi:hypothetical protein